MSGYTPQALPDRMREARRARGAAHVAATLGRYGTGLLAGLPWTVRGHRGRFRLGREEYPYLFHRYKATWLTERSVEVPVVQRLVDREPGRVLEVGNVLSHYRAAQEHTVVDKYERGPGILNRDVLDLAGLGSFDLVVAISTLEHVGWDEEPRRPDAAVDALAALRGVLNPGGRLVLTHPVGYNPHLDDALRAGAVPLARASALRRAGRTRWVEVPPDDAWRAPYDFLLYSARAVVFAEVTP